MSILSRVGKQVGGLAPANAVKHAANTSIGAKEQFVASVRKTKGTLEGLHRPRNLPLEFEGSGYSAVANQTARYNPKSLKGMTPNYGTMEHNASFVHYSNTTFSGMKDSSAQRIMR